MSCYPSVQYQIVKWAIRFSIGLDDSTKISISTLYIYALFKIAGFVQQIYARYKAGHSQDERFAGLIFAVHVLSQTAVQATESS